MENKVKTQREIGAVHLEKKGLDKERFKDLIKDHETYCYGLDESLNSGYIFIENWYIYGGYVWLSSNDPSPNSRLVTLDELEEMITGREAKQEFILPNNWSVEVTVDNVDTLSKWRGNDGLKIEPIRGWLNSDKIWTSIPKFEIITLGQFKKYVMKEKTRLILPSEAQRIINIACEGWKPKLAERWAVNIVQGKDVEITEEFYKEMRKACTPSQHELFDIIFGKDKIECPYEDGELIFVKHRCSEEWSLRYSTGKLVNNGCAEFYTHQKPFSDSKSFCKFHAKAPNVKLPE